MNSAASKRQAPTMFIRNNNASHHQPQSEVNIALVGALGSGKSALTVKYITRRFINEYDPDLEDTYTKQDIVDNQNVVVRIMDTCDKEGKDPERYLKWADGFLVVFSVTDRSSFQTAQRYLEGISQHLRLTTTYDAPLILVGNKADLERYRQVSTEEGKALASLYEATFFEASAAEEYALVERVFREAIREILREQERFMPLRQALVYLTSSTPSSIIGEERDRESKTAGSFLTNASSSAAGRSRRLRSPTKSTTTIVNTPSGVFPPRKDPQTREQNSRFSFLKGKSLKGIFQ